MLSAAFGEQTFYSDLIPPSPTRPGQHTGVLPHCPGRQHGGLQLPDEGL
jgi:hypothetical protein